MTSCLASKKSERQSKFHYRSLGYVAAKNIGLTIRVRHLKNISVPQSSSHLDSLIESLKTRFHTNKHHLLLFSLHPRLMMELDRMLQANSIYEIDNFGEQSLSWFELWKNERCNYRYVVNGSSGGMRVVSICPTSDTSTSSNYLWSRAILQHTEASQNLATFIDVNESPISCVLSVHREKVISKKEMFIETVIERFGSDRRRLQFKIL